MVEPHSGACCQLTGSQAPFIKYAKEAEFVSFYGVEITIVVDNFLQLWHSSISASKGALWFSGPLTCPFVMNVRRKKELHCGVHWIFWDNLLISRDNIAVMHSPFIHCGFNLIHEHCTFQFFIFSVCCYCCVRVGVCEDSIIKKEKSLYHFLTSLISSSFRDDLISLHIFC